MTNPSDPGRPPTPAQPPPLRLRPDRRAAAGWTLVGLLLLAMGAWLVVDTRGGLPSLLALVVFVAVTGYFAVQGLAPGRFTVELGPRWLEARVGWREIRIPWEAVDVASVPRWLGDPWLVVEVRTTRTGRRPLPGEDPADVQLHRVRIPLPVGVQTSRVHDWLERRLGGGGR